MTDVAGETKVCTLCQTEYPATSEFFSSSTKGDHNGLRCYCKPCARKKAKEYQKKNPDYWRSPGRQESRKRASENWYAAHGLEYHREWKRENRDHINELRMERRKDPEVSERERLYRKSMRDWYRAYVNEYRASHPSSTRVSKAKRRAGEERGSYTQGDVNVALVSQGCRCFYCDEPLDSKYHVDHYIPLVKGGMNMAFNIVAACAPCNLKKHTKLPSEFMSMSRATPCNF